MKQNLIVDVTQLVHWPGQLTGIPRVVQELALGFKDYPEYRVVYVSWVKELGVMCEVDLKATLERRGQGIKYVTTSTYNQLRNTESSDETSSESKDNKPSAFKAKIFAKKVVYKFKLHHVPLIEKVRNRKYERDMKSYAQYIQQPNDIFFIGAGEWWDESFIKLVENLHANGIKIVQVSHDLLPIITPQFAGHATDSLTTYNKRIIPISSLVLTVSENTKKDLTNWLKNSHLDIPKIETFRLGEDFSAKPPKEPVDEIKQLINSDSRGFIISVGTMEARKNHAILYYTYKLAEERNVDLPPIIIIGRRGWKTDDIYDYITNDPTIKKKIIPLHNVSDEELSWFYNNCLFSVYPSLYEGWGMPIAETITRGAPCLASNTSSMIEVAPGYADYFSPSSTDECLDGIIKLLNPEYRQARKDHLKSYKPTLWKESVAQVMGRLKNI